MPYKSRTPLEAQSSKWHRSRSSLAGTASEPASSKRKADKLGNKDDRPRKRARNEEDQYEYEYEYEMDLDQDLDLDEIRMAQVGQEEERWIAVDEYGLPLLGFAPSDDSASSFVGLSRYAIDVESIVRQGFGDGSDTSIGVDLYRRFRPCGAIRDLVPAIRFTGSSITVLRIIFEDEISVRKALMFDHHRLTYHVGDSLRRLWVKRATYTSEEWMIIPEHQMVSTKDEANHSTSPLIDYCRNHPTLQHLSDEVNLAISPLPPCIDLSNLPRQYWPNTSSRLPHSISRKPLKSQNDEFHAAGYKTIRA